MGEEWDAEFAAAARAGSEGSTRLEKSMLLPPPRALPGSLLHAFQASLQAFMLETEEGGRLEAWPPRRRDGWGCGGDFNEAQGGWQER